MTLTEKITEYQNSQPFKALAKRTRQTYGVVLGFLVDCYGADITVEEVSINLEKLAKFCEKRNMIGHSIQFRLQCAKIFLTWALGYEVKYSYRVPREQVKARKLKAMNRWFSDEEIEKCLDYKFLWEQDAAPIYRIMIRMFIETGMRFSELMSIKWENMKLGERMLIIADSKSEPRPAFFSPQTAEMLEQWKKNAAASIVKGDKVFPCATKAALAIRQMLFDIGIKEGGDHRAAHTFRHYTATKLFYDGGMRIEDIAFLLGDEPATIIASYLHPTPKMLKKRVDAAMGWGKASTTESLEQKGSRGKPQNFLDAQAALVKLGYGLAYASDMLDVVTYTPEMTSEELLVAALKNSLTKGPTVGYTRI